MLHGTRDLQRHQLAKKHQCCGYAPPPLCVQLSIRQAGSICSPGFQDFQDLGLFFEKWQHWLAPVTTLQGTIFHPVSYPWQRAELCSTALCSTPERCLLGAPLFYLVVVLVALDTIMVFGFWGLFVAGLVWVFNYHDIIEKEPSYFQSEKLCLNAAILALHLNNSSSNYSSHEWVAWRKRSVQHASIWYHQAAHWFKY